CSSTPCTRTPAARRTASPRWTPRSGPAPAGAPGAPVRRRWRSRRPVGAAARPGPRPRARPRRPGAAPRSGHPQAAPGRPRGHRPRACGRTRPPTGDAVPAPRPRRPRGPPPGSHSPRRTGPPHRSSPCGPRRRRPPGPVRHRPSSCPPPAVAPASRAPPRPRRPTAPRSRPSASSRRAGGPPVPAVRRPTPTPHTPPAAGACSGAPAPAAEPGARGAARGTPPDPVGPRTDRTGRARCAYPHGSRGAYTRRRGRRREVTVTVTDPRPTRPDTPLLVDTFGRTARDLRVSLTEKCSLRCTYCMPEEGLPPVPVAARRTTGGVGRLVPLAHRELGGQEVRFTGGEPLMRNDLERIIAGTRGTCPALPIALTSNAVGLEHRARGLVEAGLDRINISLDTVRRAEFAELTRRDRLPAVLRGIRAARDAGMDPVKVNAVPMRATLPGAPDLLEWALAEGVRLRFIEEMPLDADNTWSRVEMVTA